MIEVESIADLLALAPDATQRVRVNSYHAGAALGGGSLRYWDASRPKIHHNGGTVIAPGIAFPSDWSVRDQVYGWFNPASETITGSGCWVMEDKGGVFLPTEFGAKGDGVTDDYEAITACFAAGGAGSKHIFTPTAHAYRTHQFKGEDNQSVYARGARIDLFHLQGGATVLASTGSNAYYEGVYLNCLEVNLPYVRCSFENTHDSSWVDCAWVGFRDAAPANSNNAWGAYFKHCSNHTIVNGYFENNSQNDVAILEGSSNIRLIGARGPALNINIEPNDGASPIRNIHIGNSKIALLLVQENDLRNQSVNTVLVEGCDIADLRYDGGEVDFQSCRIRSIAPMPDGEGRCYAGALRLNGCVGVGPNLLPDPNFGSVSQNSDRSGWKVRYSTVSNAPHFADVTTASGRALRLNPSQGTASVHLISNSVQVVGGETYLAVGLCSGSYAAMSARIGLQMSIRWFDSSGNELSNPLCPINRGAAGASTPVALQSAVVVAPSGARSAQLVVGSSLYGNDPSSSDWYSAGLHRVIPGGPGGGLQDPMGLHQAVSGSLTGYGSEAPNQVNNYRPGRVGDRVVNTAPTASGHEGWRCTASSTDGAGTWKGYGQLQS